MKTITYLRYIGLAVVAALTLVCFSPSNSYAQYRRHYNSYDANAAVSNGYQLGFGAGSNDRARGASYDVNRNKAYRDGDSGYSGRYGDKDDYRAYFRQGYERGYSEGYNSQNGRYNRNNGYNRRYNDRRYNDRYDRYDRYDHRYDRRYRY